MRHSKALSLNPSLLCISPSSCLLLSIHSAQASRGFHTLSPRLTPQSTGNHPQQLSDPVVMRFEVHQSTVPLREENRSENRTEMLILHEDDHKFSTSRTIWKWLKTYSEKLVSSIFREWAFKNISLLIEFWNRNRERDMQQTELLWNGSKNGSEAKLWNIARGNERLSHCVWNQSLASFWNINTCSAHHIYICFQIKATSLCFHTDMAAVSIKIWLEMEEGTWLKASQWFFYSYDDLVRMQVR